MTRIPTRTAHESMQQAMEVNFSRLTDAQRQLATGKRLNKVSDAPTDALNANRLRNQEKLSNAYITAADDGAALLAAQDSALQSASTILIRVRELVTAGSSDIESGNGQQAIAAELSGLRDQLVSLANTSHDGRAVFGGFAGSAVQNTGGLVTWVGDGESIDRRVSSELTVSVNTDGRKVFGFNAGVPAGNDNVFAVINRAIAAIEADNADGARAELDNIMARQADLTNSLGSIGGRVNQIELARSQAEDDVAAFKTSRSILEDVDMGAATVDLKDAEAAYEATLAVVARMQRVSLLDFLQ
ncbi:MAG: flagellar hook-associated protein FlgL [Acidimicrobiales bacterium]|nr:flagellar hook-associated protein FlgL [Acidimicrobiales bacterium]